MKILIIGGVATGLKTASRARRIDESAEITVLERGRLISYGSCGMPYYVGGDIPTTDDLMMTGNGTLRNAEYFKEKKNFDVLTGHEALEIDRTAKRVLVKVLSDGTEKWLSYDKLVIATGAMPVKPPFPGSDLKNIFTLWHPDDARAVREGIEAGKFKRAVIIGAGLIGMEMAEALKRRGVEVTMVEMQSHVFPAFLDEDMAAIVQKDMTESGIELIFGEKVERFEGEGGVAAVITDQRKIGTDMVIMAIGARPNTELAKKAGLPLGEKGALVVDDELRTEDPDILAGGDCVENTNVLTGKKVFVPMGSTANKHGRVIGSNLFDGRHDKFRGVLGTVTARVLKQNVGKTGLSEKDARALGYDCISATVSSVDRVHYMPGAGLITLKLTAETKSGRILGVQAVGPGDVSKRIDVIAACITLGGTIEDLFTTDISYAPPYNLPIDITLTAANVIMNKLYGMFKGVTNIEAHKEAEEGRSLFVDVRTPQETSAKKLSDCQRVEYIPLDELRRRVGELDPQTAIVTVCQIGQRGYEAERILEAAGFEHVRTMEGGVAAWPKSCG